MEAFGKGESLDEHIRLLNILFAVFVINALTNWGTNYLQQYAMQRVGQGVLFRLRRALFGHVQKQSLSYFDNTEVGRLMSRVQGDVGQLQEFAALVVMSLGELLSLVGIVIATRYGDPTIHPPRHEVKVIWDGKGLGSLKQKSEGSWQRGSCLKVLSSISSPEIFDSSGETK